MEDTTSAAVADTAPSSTSDTTPSGDTSASAPSTSEPSRPTSMKQAFEQTAAKRAAEQGDAATTPPPTAPGGSPASKKGPIPFENHERIIKNTRDKSAAERDAHWDKELGWAKTIDRKRAEQSLAIADLIEQNSGAFIEHLLRVTGYTPQQFARAA